LYVSVNLLAGFLSIINVTNLRTISVNAEKFNIICNTQMIKCLDVVFLQSVNILVFIIAIVVQTVVHCGNIVSIKVWHWKKIEITTMLIPKIG